MARYWARGLCDRTEVITHASWRPPVNSHSYLHPKIPSKCHHGVVRCVGRCHLHLFPVFTSAIDSCAPIFIKPLFHSFPPVICRSLPTHTTPSSLLSLSSTSPQMSLSTHLLSAGLHTGANTQPSLFCLCRWSSFPPRVSANFSASFRVLPSYFCAFLACFGLNGSRFGSFPLAVAVSIWWAVGRKVEAPLPLLLPSLASDCDLA